MSLTELSVPKCVADTIPEDVRERFGVPPKIDDLIEGAVEIYEVAANMTSWGMGDIEFKEPRLSDSDIVSSIEHLYDFVYFRRYEMPDDYFDPALSFLVEDMNDPNLTGMCESLLLLLNFARLQTITQIGTPNLYAEDQDAAAADALRTKSSINAIAHFIQLAHLQQRIEFGTSGLYVPDAELEKRMARGNLGGALYTNQEVEFIAATSANNVLNAINRDDELKTVSSNHVFHWSSYSQVPDYTNPRISSESGTKTCFLTLPSLQSWLSIRSRKDFRPTQFLYKDLIPPYTDKNYYRDFYSKHIRRLRISEATLKKEIGMSKKCIRWLSEGKSCLFFRQALLLENLIHEKTNGPSDRKLFPIYNSTATLA